MQRDYVNFLVDGMSYCMLLEDIGKYPESYFSAAIKKEWNPEDNVPITINRDGKFFRYIVDFHSYGRLCRTDKRMPFETVKKIQVEADFYNLPLLVQACDSYVMNNIGASMSANYMYCQCSSYNADDLINVVGEIWAPFCLDGERPLRTTTSVFKTSTLQVLNLDELTAAASVAPFGKGTKTLVDKNVRDALEISADKLDPGLWRHFKADHYRLHPLSPRRKIEMKPYKLVIYKEGGHFAEHRDSVRGENHIGTLVQILNSEFTGGRLVVRQNDKEVSISKPGEFIAMYGDALHRVEPVTSGTRVALIFDLYQTDTYTEKEFKNEYGVACCVVDSELQHAVSDDTRSKVFTALDKNCRAMTRW